jgi:transcriptional regulator with XRE-family HTH domain
MFDIIPVNSQCKIMANPLEFNYDSDTLRKWLISEVRFLREEKGLNLEHFCDRLSEYFGGKEFTRGRLNKLKNTKLTERQKTLELSVLEAIAGYRGEDVETTKEWLRWQDRSIMHGDRLGNRVADLEANIVQLASEISQLREQIAALVKSIGGSIPTHPYTLEVRKILKESGIDPDTENGRSLIRGATAEKYHQSLFEILSGVSEPYLDFATALMLMVGTLAGSDKITPTLLRELGLLANGDKTSEPALELASS